MLKLSYKKCTISFIVNARERILYTILQSIRKAPHMYHTRLLHEEVTDPAHFPNDDVRLYFGSLCQTAARVPSPE